MSDDPLNQATTEEILASIRKIMSAEWDSSSPGPARASDDEEILELTKKVEPSSKKELAVSSPSTLPPPPRGTQTAEDLLSALLRPLLKEWLNQHLPSLIEKEIKKRSLS